MKQQQRMSVMRPLPVGPTKGGDSSDSNYSTYSVPSSLIQPQPENPEVIKLVCYHGNLAREIAENLVSSFGGNTFLLRDSSVRGCFAMTLYSDAEKEITHYLVYPRTSGGYSIQDCDDTNTYPNLQDLTTKSPVLKGSKPVPKKSASSAPTPADPLKGYLEELNTAVQSALKSIGDNNNATWKQDLKKAISHVNTVL